jgi:AraC family transcriptional regulator, exoenzyme S synthesis regulatory protein ExsA
MDATIYNLPQQFAGNGVGNVYIHHYTTRRNSYKNKVLFSHNLFCILVEGQKEIVNHSVNVLVDETVFTLSRAGSVFMSETLAKKGHFESWLVFFSNSFLVDFCTKYNINTNAPVTEHTGLSVFATDAFVLNFIQSLNIAEQQNLQSVWDIKITELLLYLNNRYPAELSAFVSYSLKHNPEVQFKQIIQANLDKKVTVDELAFLCNMSVSTFKRHFSKVYNATPQKYFTTHKMEKARRMLQLNHRPTDIFFELGYENLSAFSTEFKKHFGVSPRHFQTEMA